MSLVRFFNVLNGIAGVLWGIFFVGLAVAAFALGGLAGWIGGAIFVLLAVCVFVSPVLWPRYHEPRD